MKRFFLIFFLILSLSATAQTLTAHRNAVSNAYNFWVSTPVEYDSVGDSMPVILFLHGASLCGNNLERVRRYGPLHALAMGRTINAIIIAPQNPGGAWNPERVNHVVDWVFDHYRCDTNRFYVIGMSLGGYGTIDYSAAYSHRIAASVAMCGGGNPKSYCGLNEMPLWIMHGTADRAVGISQSKKVIRAMIQCGDTSRLRFTSLAGVTHSGLARAFYLPELYEWLFQHRLDTPDRPVSRDYEFTPALLSQAYRNTNRKANRLIIHSSDERKSSGKDSKDDLPAITTQGADGQESVAVSDNDTNSGSPAVEYHTIRSGDTLGKIARQHNTTIQQLCRLNNNINTKTTLRIGRKLKVR